MVTNAGSGRGKQDFVRELLQRTPQSNVEAINEAWRQAGNAGSISGSLFYKIRGELGLTGQRRSGNGAGSAEEAASKGRETTSAQAGERSKALESLEGDLDRLLFQVMGLGSLPDVEEALRRARRLVVLGSGA